MESRLHYFGTNIEIALGDQVAIQRRFRKPLTGHVCYLPGISTRHPKLEYSGSQSWVIRTAVGLRVSGYFPDHPPGPEVVFLSRGQGQQLLPDLQLEEEARAYLRAMNAAQGEPRHSIVVRDARENERVWAPYDEGDKIAAFVMLLFAIGCWVALGQLVSPLSEKFGAVLANMFCFAARIVSIALLYVIWCFFMTYRRRGRPAGKVQEVHVSDPRVLEIETGGDQSPAVCFDIGMNRLLYLQGQWLRDPGNFGEGVVVEQSDDCLTMNKVLGRDAFPNTDFTIVRVPESGDVLSVRCCGEWLATPYEPLDAYDAECDFYLIHDSELLEGRIEDCCALLTIECQKRRTSSS